MHKWDCSILIDNLEKEDQKHNDDYQTNPDHFERKEELEKAFLTEAQVEEEKKADVWLVKRKDKAHSEGITSITFVEKPECIATCSFDCHVYIWNAQLEKIGSLILGEHKLWKIKIDKTQQQQEDTNNAIQELEIANSSTYENSLKRNSQSADLTAKMLTKKLGI